MYGTGTATEEIQEGTRRVQGKDGAGAIKKMVSNTPPTLGVKTLAVNLQSL